MYKVTIYLEHPVYCEMVQHYKDTSGEVGRTSNALFAYTVINPL